MNSENFVSELPTLTLSGCVTFFKLVLKSVSSLEKGHNTTKLPETIVVIIYVKMIEHSIDASACNCLSQCPSAFLRCKTEFYPAIHEKP